MKKSIIFGLLILVVVTPMFVYASFRDQFRSFMEELGRQVINLLTQRDTNLITPPPGSLKDMICTKEAKQCPDGSYVGRGGPKCEFAACSTATSTTATSTASTTASAE